MPGNPRHPRHKTNSDLWQQAQEQLGGQRKGWTDPVKFRDLQAQRERRIASALEEGTAPDFFEEYMPALVIESDQARSAGMIPFVLFDYQREMIERLLRGENIVWVKERQIGASWLLAAYAYWVAAYHAASHVALVSMGQREANELIRKVRFIHNHLPEDLRREYSGFTSFDFIHSGSTLTAFPSTPNAGVSFRFKLIVQDEAARHPYGRANYLEYLPTVAQGGQIVICSTSNPDLGPSGFFWEIIQETQQGENDYSLVFNGRYSRPDHDEEFYEKMRRRYKMGQQEFDSHYPVTMADAFQGKTGLVFHQFHPDIHVVSKDPMPWLEYEYRVAGVDPGGGDPTAIVVMGVYQDYMTGELKWHQPAGGEFYQRGGATLDDLKFFLSRWPKLTRVYLDTAGGDVLMKSLQQLGYAAYAANKDRSYGLNLMAGLFESTLLTIHESNENSLSEFNSYRWLERTDPNDRQRYKTATPVDNHADAMDARRYAIASFTRLLEKQVAGGYRTQRDRGLPSMSKHDRKVELVWQ